MAIYDNEGSNRGRTTKDIKVVTNPITRNILKVTLTKDILKNSELFGYYVLDDKDYMQITTGLTSEWIETQVFFNVQNVDDTYDFAQTLLGMIANGSTEDVAINNFYDPVVKMLTNEKGETYFLDREYQKQQGKELIDLTAYNSSNLRINWKYMPSFAVIEQNDFVKTYAVFYLLYSSNSYSVYPLIYYSFD